MRYLTLIFLKSRNIYSMGLFLLSDDFSEMYSVSKYLISAFLLISKLYSVSKYLISSQKSDMSDQIFIENWL
jgi:hypothetical protein